MQSSALGSVDLGSFAAPFGGFVQTTAQNGWATLDFLPPSIPTGAHRLVSTDTTLFALDGTITPGLTRTYFGLPAIGFRVQTFNNGTLVFGGRNVLSSYGGAFPHRATRRIE
jgi:hypothetical protein